MRRNLTSAVPAWFATRVHFSPVLVLFLLFRQMDSAFALFTSPNNVILGDFLKSAYARDTHARTRSQNEHIVLHPRLSSENQSDFG